MMEQLVPILCILILAFGAIYAATILLFWLGWRRVKRKTPSGSSVGTTKVSIVIAVRNEENRIKDLLEDLNKLDQSNVACEVIFANDHSEDKTRELLTAWCTSASIGAKVVDVVQEKAGKKAALTVGIENAIGDWVLVTDADCRIHPNWLERIRPHFEDQSLEMLVMPVRFQDGKGMLHAFQQLELIAMVGSAGGSLGWNKPLLANGANLAFRKKAFEQVNGFEGVDHLASGDDVFLLHKFGQKNSKKVRFVHHPEIIVSTEAAGSWHTFFKQRLRWAGKSLAYRDSWTITVSFIVFGSNLMLLVGLAFSWVHLKVLWALGISFALKCIIDFIFLFLVASDLRCKRSMWWFLPEELLYSFYVVIISVWSFLTGTTWKGRKIK